MALTKGSNLFNKRHLFLTFLLFFSITICFAAPPDNGVQGRLIFLGVNHSSTKSVWLSLTSAAGSFKLEGPGNQLVDEWSKSQRGARLSLSPFVSQGNGGTHHLINAADNKTLDSQNQQGGIVFPPFSPSQPGTPSHPIVTPPGTPGSPGTPSHPIVTPPATPGTPGTPTTPGTSTVSSNISSEDFDQEAPITKARQLDLEHSWNVWSDNYYFGIRDGRNNVNTEGGATNFIIGADRHITNNFVGGFSLSAIHLDTNAYNNALNNNARGYQLGPYFGYMISPKWSVDGSFNYGQIQNNNTIVTLNSAYTTKLANATLHSTGLFQFGNFQIRPQPLISYTYFSNPTYNFNGTVVNTPVQITRHAEHFALGYAEFKVENNYTHERKNGDIIQPYVELGVDYAFVRPSDDQVYSGNLALANTPQAAGLVTLGLRAIHANKLLLQASGSYLSIGQSSYDLWDVRLLVSYSFA